MLEALEVSYSFYEVVLRLADFTGTQYWRDPKNYDSETVAVNSQGQVEVLLASFDDDCIPLNVSCIAA